MYAPGIGGSVDRSSKRPLSSVTPEAKGIEGIAADGLDVSDSALVLPRRGMMAAGGRIATWTVARAGLPLASMIRPDQSTGGSRVLKPGAADAAPGNERSRLVESRTW